MRVLLGIFTLVLGMGCGSGSGGSGSPGEQFVEVFNELIELEEDYCDCLGSTQEVDQCKAEVAAARPSSSEQACMANEVDKIKDEPGVEEFLTCYQDVIAALQVCVSEAGSVCMVEECPEGNFDNCVEPEVEPDFENCSEG